MAKTNSGLVEYAKAQVGLPYWYGCYGQTASESLYNSQKKAYADYYTASDFAKQNGKRVHDCSGLIKGYLWSDSATAAPTYNGKQDTNAAGMYSKSSRNGKIATFPKENGLLVFKGTTAAKIHHVGVYSTDGYVYEAKSHSTGVCKTKFAASDWNFWAQCPYTEADAAETQQKTETVTETQQTGQSFAAGDKVTLKNTPVYISSSATDSSGKKSGTYYIWNKKTANGRIRITNKAENVGVSGQVTGWVNVSDIGGAAASGSTSSGTSSVAGTYKVTPDKGLNIRKDAGVTKAKIIAIPKGTKVECDGTYKTSGGVKWLYVTFTYNGKSYAGYGCSTYLSKC